MKLTNISNMPPRGRRIFGHAQWDHIQDPYQRQKKLLEGTACPQCHAVYHAGRWHWEARAAVAHAELCPACQRIQEEQPAGLVTLAGPFAREHRAELVALARHQEDAEKAEHPLNRIMAVEEEDQAVVIATTDIHLPRRIGEAVKGAFHGHLDMHFDEEGYFVRVDWRKEAP